MMKQSYEDYKYVMLDTAFLYLGAKYNYGEIIENEDIPFKFRAIIEHYILPEMDAETTLESHFYFMEKKEFSYKTYQQLKQSMLACYYTILFLFFQAKTNILTRNT